jgi:hypothetical protein
MKCMGGGVREFTEHGLVSRHSTVVLATQYDSYVKRPLNAISSIVCDECNHRGAGE